MGALENALSEELGSSASYSATTPDAPPAPSRSSPKAARAKEEHKIIAAAVGATLTSLTSEYSYSLARLEHSRLFSAVAEAAGLTRPFGDDASWDSWDSLVQ
jgi:hypothetical protein